MPELPEVETVKRSLLPRLVGQRFVSLEVRLPKIVKNPVARVRRALRGSRVTNVRRRAKIVLIDFSTGVTVAVHLKMSGQLIWQGTKGRLIGGGHPIPGSLTNLPNKYSHVIFRFRKGTLYFNDLRQFGYVRLFSTSALDEWFIEQGLGPEPLSKQFLFPMFAERLRRRARTNIKAALLVQRVVAGLGNIYVDEALYAARIRPMRLVGSLTLAELKRLFRAIPAVLRVSLAHRGTTFDRFRDPDGEPGQMLSFLKVYGRPGKRCRRDGAVIIKTRLAGRGTHYCVKCQR